MEDPYEPRILEQPSEEDLRPTSDEVRELDELLAWAKSSEEGSRGREVPYRIPE